MDATIIGKLKKITSLIDRAGTPGEAEAAAAALSRLLLKYNLDEATVRQARGEEPTSSVIVKRITIDQGQRGKMWRWSLLNVIAKHNLTKVIREGAGGNDGWIVGTPQNISVVMDLFDHTSAAAQRLSGLSWGAMHYRDRAEMSRKTYVNAFLLGFSRGLREKFDAERNEQRKDHATNALVLVVERDLNKAVAEEIGKITVGHRTPIRDASAYQSGRYAGRNYTATALRGERYAALE